MSAQNRKRSALWNHFTGIDAKKAKCSYCAVILSVSGGNVGNLGRHMKTKHPTVPIVEVRQPYFQAEESQAIQDSSDPPRPTADRGAPVLTLQSTAAQPTCTMKDFVSIAKPLPPRRSELLDEQLIKMIAKEYHPLRLVEEKEFKKFVHMLCPGYSLPTRKTLTENILNRLHEKTKTKVQTKLSAAAAVCLTTDGWTSVVNESFLAITAHFITTSEKETKLDSVLISCVEYAERHTSTNLCDFIKNATIEWRIEQKITAIASDNAANITAALREGNWRQIACFAHSLNLVAKEALTHLSDTVGRVKSLVEYYKRSAHAQHKLLELQKQMHQPELKLKQDVATRWNSTYDMLVRILKIKDAVVATTALLRSDLSLNDNDWNVIEAAIPILEIFSQVTEEISAEKSVSLSKVIPLCLIMVTNVRIFLRQPCSLPEIICLLQTMDRELERRFGTYENHIIYAEATILDPRFKNKGFKDQRNYERMANGLKNRIAAVPTPTRQNVSGPEPTPQPMTSMSKKSIWDTFDDAVSRMVPQNPTAAGIVEFDKYIQEILLDRKSDPLQWWHERRLVYPLLYQYILKRLNLVATSVPCERIFSKAGYTLNERRTNLRTKKLSQLLFVNSNAE